VESLLQDVHFFSDDGYSNLWEIVHELEEHGYLLAVSDGSVKFHDMSFGWILATPTGKNQQLLLDHAMEEEIHYEQKERECCQ
jgi:hypothetical protein